MMLSTGRSASGAEDGGLAALEPPEDGEHRLTPKTPRLVRQPPGPFEAGTTNGRWRAAHPAGEEVEGAAHADSRGGSDGAEGTVEKELLTAGAERGQDHLRLGCLELDCCRLPGRAVAPRNDLDPRVRPEHVVARRDCDARRPADQRDAVSVAYRLREVGGEQVGATDTLDLGMTATAERADHADAVGNHQCGRLEHRAEGRAAPRHHHHLGVEGDDDCRMRRPVATTPFHQVHERRYGCRHVDDVDGAPEHTSSHRRARDRRRHHYRLVYCGAFRARFRPYFFRSFSRESRVSRPAALSTGRSSGSAAIRARAIPWHTAPACPAMPPPKTLTETSKRPVVSVTRSGCVTTVSRSRRPKYSLGGRLLTTMTPSPGTMRTRATAVLRRPVACLYASTAAGNDDL